MRFALKIKALSAFRRTCSRRRPPGALGAVRPHGHSGADGHGARRQGDLRMRAPQQEPAPALCFHPGHPRARQPLRRGGHETVPRIRTSAGAAAPGPRAWKRRKPRGRGAQTAAAPLPISFKIAVFQTRRQAVPPRTSSGWMVSEGYSPVPSMRPASSCTHSMPTVSGLLSTVVSCGSQVRAYSELL